jgi:hypothetical protein
VETKQQVRQAQIIFACPDRKHIAIRALSSEALADWRASSGALSVVGSQQ